MIVPDATLHDGGVHEFAFSFEELGITPHAVARGLGYTDAPEHLIDAINELLPAAGRLVHPRGGFRIFPSSVVSITSTVIYCDGTDLLTGRVIAKRLRPSTGLAVFVATAGPDIEAWSRELMDGGDMIQGFVVDAIGSDAVERASEALQTKLAAVTAASYQNITNCYSPGYCGWTVHEQHKLFSLLPSGFCGVRLNESALMTPVKSVSGIVGLGPLVVKKEYECSLCDMERCHRRRSPYFPDVEKEGDQ